METLKGRVSNIKRDVEVIGPDYSGDSYSSGSTSDITRFVLGGRSMQYESSRPTYDAISDGDELIVAGKYRQRLFHVTAYKNVTKNLTSYKERAVPLVRVIGILVLTVGIALSAILFFIGNSVMPLLFSLPFLGAGAFLLYFDYKHATAVKAIETYK